MKKAQVGLVKCERYEDVKESIIKALKDIGCFKIFENRAVLLKINLNKGADPKEAVNTHPEFVRSMIQIIKTQGGIPFVGDSSGILGFTKEAFRASGIEKVVKEEGARLINFDAVSFVEKKINGKILKSIYMPKDVEDVDIRITLPKLKYHTLTLFTGALKNQLGILPGGTKCMVHRLAPTVVDLSQAIIDINLAIKFDLAIMDGVVGLEWGGSETGIPKRTGIIAASTDLVALDSICSYIIGLDPMEVATNRIGQERGLGSSNLDSIEIVGDDIENCVTKFRRPGFNLKRNPLFAKLIFGIRRSVIKPFVIRNSCEQCGKCAEVCPVRAISLTPFPKIARRQCIYCYCCHENCPTGAMKLTCNWYFKPLLKRKTKGMELRDLV